MDILNFIVQVSEESFIDSTGNKLNRNQLDEFILSYKTSFQDEPDWEYTRLISEINGFEVNGLNVYGSYKNPSIYVSSIFDQNDFWSVELPRLSKFVIIGDADMDFIVKDIGVSRYRILSKSTLDNMRKFDLFSELLEYLSNTYL